MTVELPERATAAAAEGIPPPTSMSIGDLKAELMKRNELAFASDDRVELEAALEAARAKDPSGGFGSSSRVAPSEIRPQPRKDSAASARVADAGRYESAKLSTNMFELRHVKKSEMIKLAFDKSGGDKSKMFVGKKSSPFFSDPDGYLDFSKSNRLSDRITGEEWRRLDQEFLTVWNGQRASRTPVWKKHCITWGSALCFFLIVPCFFLCWLNAKEKKRDFAVAEMVAKVNKYIFRPRGMFLKLRVEFRRLKIDTQLDNGDVTSTNMVLPDECYYLAIGPEEVQALERQDIFDWESFDAVAGCDDKCCGCTKRGYDWSAKKYLAITEDTIEEDEEFKQRWPTPSA